MTETTTRTAPDSGAEVVLPVHTDLLRLATAGSVDDGKSTLVGRLLHDTKSVLADQLDAVHRASACLLYTSPSPRDRTRSRMPSSA